MRFSTLVFIVSATTALIAQSSSPYRVTHTYTLGEDGSWDYIVPDSASHRLYIARHDRLMVVDDLYLVDGSLGNTVSGDRILVVEEVVSTQVYTGDRLVVIADRAVGSDRNPRQPPDHIPNYPVLGAAEVTDLVAQCVAAGA